MAALQVLLVKHSETNNASECEAVMIQPRAIMLLNSRHSVLTFDMMKLSLICNICGVVFAKREVRVNSSSSTTVPLAMPTAFYQPAYRANSNTRLAKYLVFQLQCTHTLHSRWSDIIYSLALKWGKTQSSHCHSKRLRSAFCLGRHTHAPACTPTYTHLEARGQPDSVPC